MSATSVAVVRKALVLLEHLGLEGDVGVSQASRELHLPLATVHRLLATLCSAGYVVQNPSTQDYHLSVRVLALSASVLGRLNVRVVALPHMQRLAASWRETVSLAVREGNRIFNAESLPSPESLRFVTALGDTFAPHCSGLAKAICAHLTRVELMHILPKGRLARFTPKTITNRRILLRHLAEARLRGYALDDEERHQGIRSLAAPIWDRDGKAIAAVCLVAPSVRMPDARITEAAPAVISTAEEISKALGFCAGTNSVLRPLKFRSVS
jgi:IclR family transcriptional regulator, acetate operon repressor